MAKQIATMNIWLADGSFTLAIGKGEVVLSSDLILKNVLLVPSFPANLRSIYRLSTNNNCHVLFSSTHCLLQDATSKRQIGCGFSRRKLYYLSTNKTASSTIAVFSPKLSAMQWHVRLGHPNLNKLKLLVPTLGSVSLLKCEM